MSYRDLLEVRNCYAALRELVIMKGGGWNDADARVQADRLCSAGIAAVEDRECHEHLRAIRSQSAELFSRFGHLKFGRENMSGADYLRLQILISLEALNTRLFYLETQRDRSASAAA